MRLKYKIPGFILNAWDHYLISPCGSIFTGLNDPVWYTETWIKGAGSLKKMQTEKWLLLSEKT
jgi:hypothetical protein